jgi:hypothetical protein
MNNNELKINILQILRKENILHGDFELVECNYGASGVTVYEIDATENTFILKLVTQKNNPIINNIMIREYNFYNVFNNNYL